MAEKPKAGSAKPQGGGANDPWLTDQLRQLYDEVASEPLPKDFVDLLDRIDEIYGAVAKEPVPQDLLSVLDRIGAPKKGPRS